MLTQEEKTRLKRLTSLYARIPAQLIIEDNDQHSLQYHFPSWSIHLGTKAPYRYLQHMSQEGYELFIEGLLFHELASLLYTDFHIVFQLDQEASSIQQKTNQYAYQYSQKQIKRQDLKDVLMTYVKATNLPLLLKAMEDGAIENSMGIEHPETWNALMYARTSIVKSYLSTHHSLKDESFLMDKIMLEMMMICTYGYRFSLKDNIIYLPHYLPEQFEAIRKLAIKARLLSQTTRERLKIAQNILEICTPLLAQTVNELIDTIQKTPRFSSLPPSLFSKASEIAVSFQDNNQSSQPQQTKPKYHIDISDEDFQRIESLEEQNEKVIQQEILQDIYKRQKETQEKQDKQLKKDIQSSQNLDHSIIHAPLQRETPTKYGLIALQTKNISITRSNKLAQMLKRERMYASKSTTKHKLEYGKKLDQPYLYRATIDGRVFKEHKQGKKKDLCVYILVDNSESMSGDKIINAMKGCFELARVLQTLHIPFCISSHKSVGKEKVQMTPIVSFQECKKRNVLDRIFCMHVSGGTHEDIALEYVLKELSQYQRQKKGFVFVLSDGDTPGIKRIHELTRIYKKEHDIDVIGIGVQPAYKIQEAYPHSIFVDDLNLLPDMLIKKLREIAL